jgi:hypothetical protein
MPGRYMDVDISAKDNQGLLSNMFQHECSRWLWRVSFWTFTGILGISDKA